MNLKLRTAAIFLLVIAPNLAIAQGQRGQRGGQAARNAGPIHRMPDGKPDLTGMYGANSGGANYGLEQKTRDFLSPGTQGVIVDPPDGKLPYQDWSRKEHTDRQQTYRGYDDPTAHCFVAGVPRSMYTPSPYQILQPPGYIVMNWEFMHSYRIIPTDDRAHSLGPNVHLFEGDSVGHWEGDTLVVDTTNLNDRTWFDTAGNFHSDQLHVVERFTMVNDRTINYEPPWKTRRSSPGLGRSLCRSRATRSRTTKLWSSDVSKAIRICTTTSKRLAVKPKESRLRYSSCSGGHGPSLQKHRSRRHHVLHLSGCSPTP